MNDTVCSPPVQPHPECLRMFVDGSERMERIESTCARIEGMIQPYIPYLSAATEQAEESAKFWADMRAKLAAWGMIGVATIFVIVLWYLIRHWLKAKGLDIE